MADTQSRAQLLLEIVSRGAAETGQGLNRLAGQANQAQAAWQRLNEQATRMERGRAALSGGMADVKSGNYLQQAREITTLAGAQERLAIAQRRLDLVARTEDVRSGNYLQRAQEMVVLNREQEKLATTQRHLGMIAREGHFVGGLRIMQERLQTIGRIGAYAFGALTASLGGWIRSGMQGTAEAQRLQIAIQSISRSIAGTFAPQIQALVRWVNQLAVRLREMSGEQQEVIRRWVALTAAVSGSMLILPRLLGLLATVATAWRAVATAAAAAGVAQTAAGVAGAAGAGGLAGRLAAAAGPVGLGVAVAGVGILAASEEGRKAMANLAKSAQPLLEAFGKLASNLSTDLAPAILKLSEGLADAVNALTDFINWMDVNIVETLGGWGAVLTPGLDVLSRLFGGAEETALDAAGKPKPKTGLTAAGSGFEGVEDLYRRLAIGVSRHDTPEDRIEKNTKETAEGVRELIRQAGSVIEAAAQDALRGARQAAGAGSVS